MRLANSTTYWMAWVIWMAHCCHSTSRGCEQEHTQFRANNANNTSLSPDLDLDPHLALVHLDLFVRVRLPSQLLQLIRCVLTCLQVGLDYILSNSVWKRQNITRLFHTVVWRVHVFGPTQTCSDKRVHLADNVLVQSTIRPLSDSEASAEKAFSVAAHLPLNSTVAWICSKSSFLV